MTQCDRFYQKLHWLHDKMISLHGYVMLTSRGVDRPQRMRLTHMDIKCIRDFRSTLL